MVDTFMMNEVITYLSQLRRGLGMVYFVPVLVELSQMDQLLVILQLEFG